MKILIIIGIIMLCFNTLRFTWGGIALIFSKKARDHHNIHNPRVIIWNAIESIVITTTLVVLIVNYYG